MTEIPETDAEAPDTLRRRADDLFQQALERRNARDPRDYYRRQLRELRKAAPERYREAVEYYEETLIPTVASGRGDPLEAWTEYGLMLARLRAPGRAVMVDRQGGATAFAPPAPTDRLVVHLPEEWREPGIVVALPTELSPAQQATYDLLIAGRRALRDAG